jgi:peroxiredoxin Q/BCP
MPANPKSKTPSKSKPQARSATSAASPATTGRMVAVGETAPDFQLPDQSDRTHRLSQYRGRWVVLYFYPKDHTSGCTDQACRFRDQHARIARHQAVVLGISPDSVKSHAGFADKFNLPFTLLADEGSKVCDLYGVWQEKSMYGRKYLGVVRTTYLIDPQGRVAARWDKVKVPGHEQQVLDELAAQSTRDT